MKEGEMSVKYRDSVINVFQWCNLNALILNTFKTEKIIFGATQDTHIDPIPIHNQIIKQT